MLIRFYVVLLLLLSLAVEAQVNRYVVFFRDKSGTPYSVNNPSGYLSQKAIERRAAQGIAVTENDLPVNPVYIQSLTAVGADVLYTSRWFNAALVNADISLLGSIASMSQVAAVELVAPDNPTTGGRNRATKEQQSVKEELTTAQLSMLGIDRMQADGFRGEGISIAIFDSGFSGVNVSVPFTSIFQENRFDQALSYNYVSPTSSVFNNDDHGTRVFSVIGASIPETFTGGALKANFSLFVTEDVSSEYRIEEYYWLLAAERADSAGVNIINSSLGYNTFDLSSMNYAREDMNGQTAVVSRAASLAADKGMLVVTSAGNEGADARWRIITAPADADNVLATGSVNSGGLRSGSSSTGPTSDNRIKPDVMALGVATAVIRGNGQMAANSGTSFSAPLVTALAAGVWQRYPMLKVNELIELIRSTSSQADNPDNLNGYGIPNYNAIVNVMEPIQQTEQLAVFPNPVKGDAITLRVKEPGSLQQVSYTLYTQHGQVIQSGNFQFSWSLPQYQIDVSSVSSTLLLLQIKMDNQQRTYKIVRLH